MQKKGLFLKITCWWLAIMFTSTAVLPESNITKTVEKNLSDPSQLLSPSRTYSSPILRGIKINPDNPLRFEFIVDTQNEKEVSETQIGLLIEYFLTALTIPEEDLWVNLSPYEKDKIIPDTLEITELGKNLLEQDYTLKQLTASLIYPDNYIGKQYWDQTYAEVYKIARTTNIAINTFNKVWTGRDGTGRDGTGRSLKDGTGRDVDGTGRSLKHCFRKFFLSCLLCDGGRDVH